MADTISPKVITKERRVVAVGAIVGIVSLHKEPREPVPDDAKHIRKPSKMHIDDLIDLALSQSCIGEKIIDTLKAAGN